ncbi:MAG: efflux transporter periplasmic adaptor subunit [Flavobacteriales bacterium]|nr:efflux transporter periplasmic adaptor subunit [Flavobacteriales bacterium]|tara:strand:- start:109090 stop:110871 length:1782 start_codon:yes stop_codon:yes gene_type:complete
MKNINKTTVVIAISTLAVGLLLGWIFFGKNSKVQPEEHNHAEMASSDNQTWTCSMHPQIKRNEPGDCPICGMDLIPLESESSEIDPMAVSMSPTAMQLAQVQTTVVGSGDAKKSIRLSGKVQADERLLFTQSSHIPGRIEKLTVNFTGEFISEGQIIAYVYSPELVTAQEELVEARKIKETQPSLFLAAKEKLKNWKLTDKQIEQILSSDKKIEQFPILANVSGYVTEKMVNLGDYIKQGQPIYEIADLSKVWILFDVYESDMEWVKKGDSVFYTIQSISGETFRGKISYIDPVIDPKSRVAQARVEVKNPDFKLKPEMFASATVKSEINLAEDQIVVPKSAVMWTGKRSLVYVMEKNAKRVAFKMREVRLGAELGERYVIESGLDEGEEIAVKGTFSIDAAAQLAGKPSMMSPEGGQEMTGHNHGKGVAYEHETPAHSTEKVAVSEAAQKALASLYESYFKLKDALVSDDFKGAKNAATQMGEELDKIDMNVFKGKAQVRWMKLSKDLNFLLHQAETEEDIEKLRANFFTISKRLIDAAETFDPMRDTIYVLHCPMANSNNGADWLSLEKEIRNPYFGAQMLKCGEVKSTIN